MLQSGSLQTPVDDFNVPGILDGHVTGMDVLDPTESNEKTSLLEVDDEFDVLLTWNLTGAAAPVVGGYWIVSLYSDDMDGVGTRTGLISGPVSMPFIGGGPFQHTFKVAPPTPQVGQYKLTATINYSQTGNAAQDAETTGQCRPALSTTRGRRRSSEHYHTTPSGRGHHHFITAH